MTFTLEIDGLQDGDILTMGGTDFVVIYEDNGIAYLKGEPNDWIREWIIDEGFGEIINTLAT